MCMYPCSKAPPPKLGGAWKRGYWLRSSSSHDGPVLVVSAEDASHTDSSRVQVGALDATQSTCTPDNETNMNTAAAK